MWNELRKEIQEFNSERASELDTGAVRPFSFSIPKLDSALLGEEVMAMPEIPLDSAQYKKAKSVIEPLPERIEDTPGTTIIANRVNGGDVRSPIQFGYTINDSFRYIGPVNYLKLDKAGNVAEVSFPSEEAEKWFWQHFNGRELDAAEERAIHNVQTEFYQKLKQNHELTNQLYDDLSKRDWSHDLIGQAFKDYKLTKYDPKIARKVIKEWINSRQPGKWREKLIDQLYLAGLVEVDFSKEGKRSIRIPDEPHIRIGFTGRDDAGKPYISTARMRMEKGYPKYRGAPLRREVTNPLAVHDQLFNHHKLKYIKGKPLVITEGEFKAMVAEMTEGTTTVGIPGITQMTDEILDQIVAAEPSEITVIMDRDPVSKAWQRADGITDSERASYNIAKRLENKGAKVKVGIIPDVFDGEKCGIDDLILSTAPGAGLSAYQQIMETALEPDEYAKKIGPTKKVKEKFFDEKTGEKRLRTVRRPRGLDIEFNDILQTRLQFNRESNRYKESVKRGGKELSPELLKRQQELHEKIERIYEEQLTNKFWATRYNEPVYKHQSLKAHQQIHEKGEYLTLRKQDERKAVLPNLRATGDIMIVDIVPENVPEKLLWYMKHYETAPFKVQHMRSFLKGEEVTDWNFNRLLERGMEMLKIEDPEAIRENPRLLSATLSAGYLKTAFPPDDYEMQFGVEMLVNEGNYSEKLGEIPLTVIDKKWGMVVAFATLPVVGKTVNERRLDDSMMEASDQFNLLRDVLRPKGWRRSIVAKRQQVMELLFKPRDVETTLQRLKPADVPQSDLHAIERTIKQVAMHNYDVDKIWDVMETAGIFGTAQKLGLFDQEHNPTYELTSMLDYLKLCEKLEPLGFTEQMIRKNRLQFISAEKMDEYVMQALYDKDLLHQAQQMGLLERDEFGQIQPRFKGDVVLAPMRNNEAIPAIMAMPLDEIDAHTLPDGYPRLFHRLNGRGQEYVRAYQTRGQFFRQDALKSYRSTGKPLIITSNEMEAMQVLDASGRDATIISLNGSFELTEGQLEMIREAEPSEIHVFVSGGEPPHALDELAADDIPGYLKQLYKLENELNQTALEVPKLSTNEKLILAGAETPGEEIEKISQRLANSPSIFEENSDEKITINILHSDRPSSQIKPSDLSAAVIMGASVPLQGYLKEKGFFHNRQQTLYNFSTEFLNELEPFLDHIEFRGGETKLNNRYIMKLPGSNMREGRSVIGKIEAKYKQLKTFVENRYGENLLPPLEQYLQYRLDLKEPMPIREIARKNIVEGVTFSHKPVFDHHAKDQNVGNSPTSSALLRQNFFTEVEEKQPLVNELLEGMEPEKKREIKATKAPAKTQPKEEGKVTDRVYDLDKNPFELICAIVGNNTNDIPQPECTPLARGHFRASGTFKFRDKEFSADVTGVGVRKGTQAATKVYWRSITAQLATEFPNLFKQLKVKNTAAEKQAKTLSKLAQQFKNDLQALKDARKPQGVKVSAVELLQERLREYGLIEKKPKISSQTIPYENIGARVETLDYQNFQVNTTSKRVKVRGKLKNTERVENGEYARFVSRQKVLGSHMRLTIPVGSQLNPTSEPLVFEHEVMQKGEPEEIVAFKLLQQLSVKFHQLNRSFGQQLSTNAMAVT